MELQARKKKAPVAPVSSRKRPSPARPEVKPHDVKDDVYSDVLQIRCNTLLYDTIHNMILSSHTAQDFTYRSPSDVIRSALQAYQDGMELTELEEQGEKVSTTIRVDRAMKTFYASLPDRMRTKLLERAIRTFLKQRR